MCVGWIYDRVSSCVAPMYPDDVCGWRVWHVCEFHVVCGVEVLRCVQGAQLLDVFGLVWFSVVLRGRVVWFVGSDGGVGQVVQWFGVLGYGWLACGV